MADTDTYGQMIKWRAYLLCPGPCGEHVDFAPGTLAPDGVTEIRTCADCGTQIHTIARFRCPPREATDWLD